MADSVNRAQRSALMAKVRGRGNATTEGALAAVLWAQGWSGWRRQQALNGSDAKGAAFRVLANFIFWLTALFGCEKFRRNQERDCRDTRNLRRAGWNVVRLWEHELRTKARPRLLAKLCRLFAQAQKSPTIRSG